MVTLCKRAVREITLAISGCDCVKRTGKKRVGGWPAQRGIERLEQRRLLSTVTWNGAGDGANWSDPLNWAGGSLPGSADVAEITSVGTPGVTFNTYATIQGLVSTRPLTMAGGSLTISGDNTVTASHTDDALSMIGGTFTVSGGTSFVANGTTTLATVNLLADAGGKMSFPAAAAYTNGVQNNFTIQANGAGSRIDLSHLTSVQGSDRFWYNYNLGITASGGGEVDLAGAITGFTMLNLSDASSTLNVAGVSSLADVNVNVTGGTANFSSLTQLTNVNLNATGGGQILLPVAATCTENGQTIQANGSGSRIELPGLSSLSTLTLSVGDGGQVLLGGLTNLSSATVNSNGAGSRINLSSLTTLDGTSVTVSTGGEVDLAGAISNSTLALRDAGSSMDVTKVTGLTNGSVTVNDGLTANFAAATGLTTVSLWANSGGMILFPVATTYTNGVQNNFTIQASGAGSRIDLSHLASMQGSDRFWYNYNLGITASGGGEVDLAGAIAGFTVLNLSDASSTLNVAGVSSLGDVNVNVTGGTANFSSLTQLTNVNLNAIGGGQVLFPVATACTENWRTFQAAGSGSRIELPGLSSLSTLTLSVGDGGQILLGGLSNLSSATVNAYGAGSRINLSSLATLDATSVAATTGGEVDLAGAISNSNLALRDAGSSMDVTKVTGLTNGSVTVNDGLTANFAAATGLTTVSLEANSGGMILFPVATAYTNGVQNNFTIQASGAGSRIDLSHLTSMQGSDRFWYNYNLGITASGGGEVDLAGAIAGFTMLNLSDASSTLNVAGVSSLADVNVNVTGGTANFSSLTQLTNVNLSSNGGGQILLPVAATCTENSQTFQANSGGQIVFGILGSLSTVNLNASEAGSRINLSSLTNLNSATVGAYTGGEVDLAGAISNSNLTLSGAGSSMDVSGVTGLTSSNITVNDGLIANFATASSLDQVRLTANGGGQILFPAATTYADGVQGDFAIQATGAGSRIDLSHLTSMQGSLPAYYYAYSLSITASGGGEVDMAGAITGNTIITLSDATSTLNVAGVTSLADVNVNITGGTASFSSLTQLTNVPLTASSGGQILFPVATTVTENGQTFQANSGGQISFGTLGSLSSVNLYAYGSGSRINLSSLTSLNSATVGVYTGGEVDLTGAISNSNVTLSDAGSSMDVSGVTGLTSTNITVGDGPTANFATATSLDQVRLAANGGGQILFPLATTYADGALGDYAIQAAGTGSRIDLSHLTSLQGSLPAYYYAYSLSITASGGGEVDLAGAITGNTIITLPDATSTLNVAGVTSLDGVNVTVTGGTANFSSLTQLTNVPLTAGGGGQILFPVAMTCTENGQTIQANGPGSRINLSALANLSGNAVSLSNGGEVDLGGIITGSTQVNVSDATSTLKLAGVTAASGTTIYVSNGATLTFPVGSAITWMGCSLQVSGTGSRVVNYGTLSTDGVTIYLSSEEPLANMAGGTVTGSGTINGDVTNSGTVSPGGDGVAGMLTITGDYTQNSTGVLRIDIGGTASDSEYDHLNVNGASASLDGLEDVYLINGPFMPPVVGDSFVTVTSGNLTGTFEMVDGTSLGIVTLAPQYDSTQHALTTIASPPDVDAPTATFALLGTPVAGDTAIDFTVQYSDDVAILASSIDGGDVSVSGPTIPAALTLVSVSQSNNGTPRTAHYRMTNAGGFAVGTYTVAIKAGEVTDTAANAVAAGTLGTIILNRVPTSIALSSTSIAENQPAGTVVGTLSSSDPDSGDSFTYSLVSGTGSGGNGLFTITGNQLTAKGSFDYETKASYSVRVRTTDAGGLWYEKSFAISVADVAEPLVINGTAANDTIALTTSGSSLVVTVNGVGRSYSLAALSSITVNGLAGDDTVSFTGAMPAVIVFAGDGNDSIYGGSGNDYIDCGNGNDLVGSGPGLDTIIGGTGDDQLHGGKDNDSVDGGIGNDSLWGDMADDYIHGGDGNDVVSRGNGNDSIWGDAGDDDLRAGQGNDLVYGGIGRDTLWGDAGDDQLHGEGGNDVVYGNAGNDTIWADGGSNYVDGGDDSDVIYARNALADTVIGGAGNDQAQIDSVLDVRPLGDVETLLA